VLSVSPSEPVTNQRVTLAATVESSGEHPKGTVEFKNGDRPIESCAFAPLTGTGTATCTTAFAANDSPAQLSALYVPQAGMDLQGSVSATDDLAIDPAPTTTTLSASESTISVDGTDTFTASVHPTITGSNVPSGSVEFFDEGTPLTACMTQPLSGGEASCSWTDSIPGAQNVTAVYLGDSNFAVSSSPPQSVAVETPLSGVKAFTNTNLGSATSNNTSTDTNVTQGSAIAVVSGTASLLAPGVDVHDDNKAIVRLRCSESGNCIGDLSLDVRSTLAKGSSRKHARTVTIGTARFSVQAGQLVDVAIQLSGRGLLLLKSARGRLPAQLRVTQATGGTEVDATRLEETAPPRVR
jgi:hypothetical protein